MTREEINNLIKQIDLIKDILIDEKISLGENPDNEIGQAIYELKKVIDKLLKLKQLKKRD